MGSSHTYRYVSVPDKPLPIQLEKIYSYNTNATAQTYTFVKNWDYVIAITAGNDSSGYTITATTSGTILAEGKFNSSSESAHYKVIKNVKSGDTIKASFLLICGFSWAKNLTCSVIASSTRSYTLTSNYEYLIAIHGRNTSATDIRAEGSYSVFYANLHSNQSGRIQLIHNIKSGTEVKSTSGTMGIIALI